MPRFRPALVALTLLLTTALPGPVLMPPTRPAAAPAGVTNGQPRQTIDGRTIDAHDGQIQKFGATFYLYGTAYACGFRWTDPTSPFCGFNVYTSPDLVHWSGPAQLFDPSGAWQKVCMQGNPPGWGCFRPRVLHNPSTGLYVLWINIPGGYRALTSATPEGPFVLATTPHLSGGDEGLFADTDGTGYVAYSVQQRVFESRLTADYLDVQGSPTELTGYPQLAPFYGAEAPSMFARNGVYYVALSVPRCPYCSGTGAGYFAAAAPFGPWTYLGAFSDYSCNGQITAVTEVDGRYLFQSDQWQQTPNEAAANQFWGTLSFVGARIQTVACDVGAYPNLAYFSWYDTADPAVRAVNIHLVNPASSGQAATGAVAVPGQMLSFSIAPGHEWIGAFRPGTSAGPVQVGSTLPLLASMRTQYGQSFNEVPAQTAGAATTDLWFTWYDRVSSPGFTSDNVHVVVPGETAANVTVTIPGSPGCTVSAVVEPGSERVFTCASGFGGPVRVHSDQPVLASQRTVYYQTLNEVNALAGPGATSLVFSWYDHASSDQFTGDNLHVIAPGGSVAAAAPQVSIPGCPDLGISRYSAAEWIYSCPFGEGFGGPVTVTAAAPVLATQRVQFGSSFNEVAGQDAARAATVLYMPWYDFASSGAFTGDNVHVVAPSGSLPPSAVSATIPGCTPNEAQLSPAEVLFTCPRGSGFGGPVTITSSVPVLASQRVQYLQSFNEAVAFASP